MQQLLTDKAADSAFIAEFRFLDIITMEAEEKQKGKRLMAFAVVEDGSALSKKEFRSNHINWIDFL